MADPSCVTPVDRRPVETPSRRTRAPEAEPRPRRAASIEPPPAERVDRSPPAGRNRRRVRRSRPNAPIPPVESAVRAAWLCHRRSA